LSVPRDSAIFTAFLNLIQDGAMAKRKCGNCGAPLPRDSHLCGYCGTDWTPDSAFFGVRPEVPPTPIEPGRPFPGLSNDPRPSPWKTPAAQTAIFASLAVLCCVPGAFIYLWAGTTWSRQAKVRLTVLLAVPLAALGVMLFLDSVVYTVHGDFEKVVANAPTAGQRDAEPIDAGSVYQDLRTVGDQGMAERNSFWRTTYAGRWVEWSGTMEKINLYTTMPSELDFRVDQSELFTVTAFFDPKHNDLLREIPPGAGVTVSGRLWGYGYMFDDLYLADGLVAVAEPTTATVDPGPGS